MKKLKMKRFFGLVLVFVLSLTSVPLTCLAETDKTEQSVDTLAEKDREDELVALSENGIVASGICGDDLIWELDDVGTLIISGTGDMYDYSSDANPPWYEFKSQFKILKISDKVTKIGNFAFADCSGFTGDLIIGDSVTVIGDYAFKGCEGFTGDLIIPDSVTEISHGVFEGCKGFTGNLIIPGSVTEINPYAFSGCEGLTGDLIIPDSVTEIWNYAFSGCKGFTGDLIIPDSVTTIGMYAFSGCKGFTGDLIISDSVTSISDGTFEECEGFTGDLIIGDSVTAIRPYAFSGCKGFTGDLIIGDSVTTIYYGAFKECEGFTGDLIIGDSVTTIVDDAFAFCRGLKQIFFKGQYPSIGNESFIDDIVIAYYPYNDSTWTESVLQNYGGTITWKKWDPETGEIYDDSQNNSSITFDQDYICEINESISITATYTSENEPKNITWTCSNENAVTFSGTSIQGPAVTGEENTWWISTMVTGVTAGSYDITISVEDISATIKLSIQCKYLPSVNGWGFENYTVDPISENAWYSIFDKTKWINKKNYFWDKHKGKSGLCQGIAITSVLSYMDCPSVKEWKENATYASEFNEDDLNDCRSTTYDLTLSEYIQAIYSYQYSYDAAKEESQHKKELKENNYQPIIDRTNNFYDTHENPIAIVIKDWAPVEDSLYGKKYEGHVLIPYRVREINNEIRVYVYDCNSISLGEELDDQYIVFTHDEDGNINGWSYELCPDLVFSSSTGFMTYYGNLAAMFEPIRSSRSDNSDILFASDSSKINITTSDGNIVQYNNGKTTNSEDTGLIPIEIANWLQNVTQDNNAMFYLEDRDNIVVQNDNEEGNNVEFFIADDYSDFTVNADSNSVTEIKMNKKSYTLNTTPSSSNSVTMIYTTNDGETVINASGTVNDTATITAESGETKAVISGYRSGTITITNNGEITTENIDKEDAITVSIEEDGTISIVPGEMEHNHSYIYTDNGDGTHTKSCVDGDDTSVEEHSYVDGACEFCGAKEHVHSYGKPVFFWSDDYSSATATFSCECDDSHTVDAKVTVEETAATCTEDGKKVYTATATYDGVTESDTETVIIPAKGHQYVDTVVQPTEDEQGYTEHTCSECGDMYRDTYTDPIGEHEHTWDEGVINKEATCTEDGEIVYACTSCEETKTEVIKATGHDYHNGVCRKCGDKQALVPVTPVKPVWKSWFEKIIKEWLKHFWR